MFETADSKDQIFLTMQDICVGNVVVSNRPTVYFCQDGNVREK